MYGSWLALKGDGNVGLGDWGPGRLGRCWEVLLWVARLGNGKEGQERWEGGKGGRGGNPTLTMTTMMMNDDGVNDDDDRR